MNRYSRRVTDVNHATYVDADIYSVLKAWDVRCPARQHAIKKLLCAGQRGFKTEEQDLEEAAVAIQRAIALLRE